MHTNEILLLKEMHLKILQIILTFLSFNKLKKSCESSILVEELEHALKGMKNWSSPCCDGLTASFYKLVWEEIGNLV